MIPTNYVDRFIWDEKLAKVFRYYLKKKKLTLLKMSNLSNGELSMPYLLKISSANLPTVSNQKLQIICDILDIKIVELFNSIEISKILTE